MSVLAARQIQDNEISIADPGAGWRPRPRQKLMLKANPYLM